MRNLQQSTAATVMVFMTDSADHVSGKAGLTLTITASKNGAAFASISPTVTERGTGWYSLDLTTTHTNTLGDLALHITSTGADPSDIITYVSTGTFDTVGVIQQLLRNKKVINTATGLLTIYADDSTTPLFTCLCYTDTAGTTLYDGTTGINNTARQV